MIKNLKVILILVSVLILGFIIGVSSISLFKLNLIKADERIFSRNVKCKDEGEQYISHKQEAIDQKSDEIKKVLGYEMIGTYQTLYSEQLNTCLLYYVTDTLRIGDKNLPLVTSKVIVDLLSNQIIATYSTDPIAKSDQNEFDRLYKLYFPGNN